MLGWSIASLGAGVLAARAAALLLPPVPASIVATAVLWASLTLPAIWAIRRSRPRGLTAFRWVDAVIGAVWGILLRIAQGAFAAAAGQSAWPSAADLSSPVFIAEAAAATVIAPVVEEFFFRAVVVVGVYTIVHRLSGRVAAVVAALIVSTVLFVAAHGLVAPLAPADASSLALVGAVAGICVLATGRIWPAILVHAVYNLTGIAVVVVATLAV